MAERVWSEREFQSAFHWHVFDQGIGHTYIRPATPTPRQPRRANPGSNPVTPTL